MRNFKFIFAAFISMFYLAAFSQQFGYWMLNNNNPTGYSNAAVNKLYFYEGANPVLIPIENTYNYDEPPPYNDYYGCINTAGAYTYNGGFLIFFAANNGLYHITDPNNRIYELVHSFDHLAEIQIINCFEDDNNFLVYSIHGNEGIPENYWDFHETRVNVDANGFISIESDVINEHVEDHISTAITEWDSNEERDFFISTFLDGLLHYTIESDGIDLSSENVILNPNELTDPDYFNAYNMELKEIQGENGYIAWISMHGDGNFLFYCEQDGDDFQEIDLGMGRLAGIEFSPIDDEIIYISYENASNEGILKYNFITQQIISYIVTGDYGNTFLQTAPDGNIYAVPDDGLSLARINMTTETFEEDIVTFVSNNYIYTYYLDDSDVKYYTLPENSQTWTELSATVEVVDVTCPGGSDGSATVIPTGGSGEYTYVWYESDCTTPLDPPETGQSINGYPVGTYCCIVTDEITGQTFEILAIIDVGYNFTHPDFMEVISTTGQTWNNVNYSFEIGLTITNNSTLTINNSTLEFAPEAKVIIEPGSKLILNETTLTDLTDCPAMWQGVEVWGIETEHQYEISGACPQGQLIIENLSVIEHAINAVSLWHPYDNTTAGGVVKAYNSSFINNMQSAVFTSFHNFYPGWPGIETNNESRFIGCTFTVNSNYLEPISIPFIRHINMSDVKGITITDCDFSSDIGIFDAGQGISSYLAGFKIDKTITGCTFQGFHKAILASDVSSYAVTIEDAIFSNNANGIILSAVDNATILFNEFYIGYNYLTPNPCPTQTSYGIDMDHCTGFAIEENYFTKYANALLSRYVGVRIAETEATDEVYKNTFDGLSYGNYAVGQNYVLNFTMFGLAYFCNLNTNNSHDFTVKKNVGNVGGVQDPIGGVTMPAGNTFSPNAAYNFNNRGDYWIGYYYYAPTPGNINTIYYPDNIYQVTREEVVGIQNECLSHYGGGGIGAGRGLTPEEMQQAELDYVNNLNDYNNVKVLYDNLKDGGDTEATLTDVETAWPNDTWELRAELLGKSPHLSMDVLKAAADKTDVLPESIIFEIMAANPDELKKEELIAYL